MSFIARQWSLFEAAYQADHWAELIGNWLVTGGLSIAILLWAAIAAMRLHAGVRRFCQAIDDASARLATTPTRALEFAGSYKTVAATFEHARIIGPAWCDWSATIISPATSGFPVRSTSRPNNHFSLDILRDCGINPRLHAATPKLLVGVGLLLTSIGLAVALPSVDGIAEASVSPSVGQVGVRALLDIASVKFATSLFGLVCSLAYMVFRGRELDRAERTLGGFLAALEERIPLATPVTLQAESNGILEKLLSAQSTFENDLPVNIERLLEQAMDHRLEKHIVPLREAIEKLSGKIDARSGDMLRTSLEEFRTMLQGSAQTHMEKLVDILARISEGVEQVRAGVAETATRMAGTADQIAEQAGRNAEQVMAQITLETEALVDELKGLAKQSRSVGNDAMADAARLIGDAGDSFGHTVQSIATSLEQIALGVARLSGEAEATTRRMTEELANAIAAMRDLAEHNRLAGDEATRAMADRIGGAAAGLERSAAQLTEALASGVGDAAAHLTVAIEAVRHHFTRLTGEHAGNVESAPTQCVLRRRDGARAVADAAEATAGARKAGGQEGGDARRFGGADASRESQVAPREFSASARELGQHVTALQCDALELQRSQASMQQASIAAKPLPTAASDLIEVGAYDQKKAADSGTVAQRRANCAEEKLAEAVKFFDALEWAMEINKRASGG